MIHGDHHNLLLYGDNLHVLPHIPDEHVDLVYLDPPFNSKRTYNVTHKSDTDPTQSAQARAFDDTWTWTHDDEQLFDELRAAGGHTADAIGAMFQILGKSDMMSYLVMMTARLAECRRVMKPTASLYLHCDGVASHYIKVMLDAIFGAENYLNNVVWLYGLGGSSKRYWPRKHDDILFYSKTPDRQLFAADKVPATSNRMKGQMKKAPDYWDIPSLNNQAKERLGYPTQKPVALLERIIRSSCPEDGIVLDPFCGSGTSLDAAGRLGRRWIGVDNSRIAVDLASERLNTKYHSEWSNAANAANAATMRPQCGHPLAWEPKRDKTPDR